MSAWSELNLVRWTAEACLAGATLGCLYLLLTSVLVSRFRRARSIAPRRLVPVTILKPLHGAEPRLFAQLASFCNQNYAGQLQLVFGTHNRDDPALKTVQRLRASFPEKEIGCSCNLLEHGTNRKISNLINMLPLAQYDILVIADSDIQVGPGYLAGVVNELEKPGVGAVTCLYHGIAGAGFWSRLSALAINTHYLPEVVLALSFRLAQPCFGATIAMRRETLMCIGGFSDFADCLADDYSIGEAVRSCGQEVAIPPFSVGHVCVDSSFSAVLAQQIRLSQIIKSIDPLGYAGSIITYPLPLALISALLVGGKAVPLLAIVLGCRIVLSASVARAFRLAPQAYWLIPVQDLISFLAYIGSYFGTAVSWRGQRYRILKGGRLVQDGP